MYGLMRGVVHAGTTDQTSTSIHPYILRPDWNMDVGVIEYVPKRSEHMLTLLFQTLRSHEQAMRSTEALQ